jgi:hypothetical protein
VRADVIVDQLIASVDDRAISAARTKQRAPSQSMGTADRV